MPRFPLLRHASGVMGLFMRNFVKKIIGTIVLFYGVLESASFVKFLDWIGRVTATRDIFGFMEGWILIPPTNYGYFIAPTLIIVGLSLLIPSSWLDAIWIRPVKNLIGKFKSSCITLGIVKIPSETVSAKITPRVPLTFDEKQFRLELRKFVASLDDAYVKLMRVFGELLQRDSDTNQEPHKNERYFASNSIDVIGNNTEGIDGLKSMTQINVDDMDADAIEAAIVSFITNNYRVWQLHVWRFNQIAKIDINKLGSLSKWLDADSRCLKALHDLQSFPQANTIKRAVEAHMGDGRLWDKGE